ncbi:uncharacterized protein HMPREF1541_06213 [Cyphellophora europaea CBS 101466]|uniref:Diphthine--ammonia ligase n=1 Tax=Cyphellophora europaea (strain CBS 101466) TaxID=1220924 RepID=W2RNY0_CYPE1|nr:uncharacterized protein HMPREF1541_06213 [Cyphellophora europaea CBS 101466]ETN38182.1 hypothetical protein HMPREF1541_06213 [Cyphellophora europaea CBS 101466]
MSGSLNVIALISGGKDSFYSILHCLHHGHRLVALANLHPPLNYAEQDMESMMYQTIGHNVIGQYEAAIGRPLYRQAITGTASCTDQDYSPCSNDETEDLRALLQRVLAAHPEANAVSSGAILSTYQRTRVESVAVRLGLTPLSYLWQYPFLPPPLERIDSVSGLLDDMAAAGCHARLIKVSSGGIDASLIGQDLAESRTVARIINGARRFVARNQHELRAAIIGEGGEYESIAVDGPFPLWKCYLSVQANDFQAINGQGGAVHGSIPIPTLSEKDAQLPTQLRVPVLLDSQFLAVKSSMAVQQAGASALYPIIANTRPGHLPTEAAMISIPMDMTGTEHHVAIGNITGGQLLIVGEPDDPTQKTIEVFGDLEDQMLWLAEHVKQSFRVLSALYQKQPGQEFDASDVVSSTLLLASMADFAIVNKHYQAIFNKTNPPARVTIATNLPPSVKVSLSILIDLRPRQTRRGLHVQSRSYWAPANIGPYSQAIAAPLCTPQPHRPNIDFDDEPELVHMAGQIPLIPNSMEMLSGSFIEQAVLSLQHLWRVGQERKVDLWTWGVAFVSAHPDTPNRALTAIDVWQKAHLVPTRPLSDEDEQDLDPWDRQNNLQAASQHSAVMAGEGDHIHVLPNLTCFKKDEAGQLAPPCVVAEVAELPRSAPIEWWSTGLGNLPRSSPRIAAGSVCCPEIATNIMEVRSLKWMGKGDGTGTIDNDGANFFTLAVFSTSEMIPQRLHEWMNRILEPEYADGNPKRRVVQGHCLVAAGADGSNVYKEIESQDWMKGVAVVPCRRLFVDDVEGRKNSEAEGAHEAVLVFLLRTEHVEPKALEKLHGRRTWWDKKAHSQRVHKAMLRETKAAVAERRSGDILLEE